MEKLIKMKALLWLLEPCRRSKSFMQQLLTVNNMSRYYGDVDDVVDLRYVRVLDGDTH